MCAGERKMEQKYPSARDEFRKRSVISPVATGTITGMGFYRYKLALDAVAHLLESK